MSRLHRPVFTFLLLAIPLLSAACLAQAGRPAGTLRAGRSAAMVNVIGTPRPDNSGLTVTIYDDKQQYLVHTETGTVAQALQTARVNLRAGDHVEPGLTAPLSPGLAIVISRAKPFTIQVDGQLLETHSHHHRAADVVAAAGIPLTGADYVRPGPETPLRPGDVIEVVRVTENFRLLDTPLPYDSEMQPTDRLEIDHKSLLRPGEPGILRQRLRVRFENGVEVSQTIDGEWVEKEPVNELIGYGTRIVIRSLDTPDGIYNYWRVVRMRVTAYTAATSGKEPEHPAYGITASGLQAGTGIVAVDKDVVPWKSWVYVFGYGPGFAGDTGGGVIGRWIDLGFDEDALVPWSGYTDVFYLAPPPPPEEINYLLPEELP